MKKSQFFLVALVLLTLSMFVLFSFFRTTDTASVTLFTKSSSIEFKNIQTAIKEDNLRAEENSLQGDLCTHFEYIYSKQGIRLGCKVMNYNSNKGNYSINFTSNDLHFSGYIY